MLLQIEFVFLYNGIGRIVDHDANHQMKKLLYGIEALSSAPNNFALKCKCILCLTYFGIFGYYKTLKILFFSVTGQKPESKQRPFLDVYYLRDIRLFPSHKSFNNRKIRQPE